jgi:hypothetical protein
MVAIAALPICHECSIHAFCFNIRQILLSFHSPPSVKKALEMVYCMSYCITFLKNAKVFSKTDKFSKNCVIVCYKGVNLWSQKKIDPKILVAFKIHNTQTLTYVMILRGLTWVLCRHVSTSIWFDTSNEIQWSLIVNNLKLPVDKIRFCLQSASTAVLYKCKCSRRLRWSRG